MGLSSTAYSQIKKKKNNNTPRFERRFEKLETRYSRYEQIRTNYMKKFCTKRADAQSRGEKMIVAWVMASGTKRELRSAVSNHREGTLPGNSSLSTKSLRPTKLVTVTNFEFKIARLVNFLGFKSIRRF